MSTRSRKRRRSSIAVQSPPQVLTPAALERAANEPLVISVVRFHEGRDCIVILKDLTDLMDILGTGEFIWIDAHGPANSRGLQDLGALCGVHALAIEDLSNTHQRAKVEQYEANTFIILRTVAAKDHLDTGQVNLVLGDRFLLTVHQGETDVLAPVKDRIQKSTHRTRYSKQGYLAYSIIDWVIDGYFPVLEHFADRLDNLEDRLLRERRGATLMPVYEVKNDLIMLRRLIWSHRDLLSSVMRDPPDEFDKEVLLYLRDCYDHTLQQLDVVEIYRESTSGLIDHIFSSATHKTNEIMKVLTIVASIFIPLNFVASVYGMNFDTAISPLNMPELSWYYGYPFALTMMGLIGVALLWLFYRNDWL